MNKEESPYEFKVHVYMNQAEDLEIINQKMREKLDEFQCSKVEHSSIFTNKNNKCEKAKFIIQIVDK